MSDEERGRSLREVFDEEISAFNREVDRFASLHRDLGFDPRGTDPTVQRLTQGTAFFMARIRREFEHHQQATAQSVLAAVAPGFYATVPSITVIELAHPKGKAETFPDGTEFFVGGDRKNRMVFVTTRPVSPPPARITAVRYEPRASLLHVDLEMLGDATAASLGESWPSLRIFLSKGPHKDMADRLLYALAVPVDGQLPRVTATVAGNTVQLGKVVVDLPTPEHPIVPGVPSREVSRRLLLEYHACPDALRFVRVTGLDALVGHDAKRLTLHFPIPDARNGPDLQGVGVAHLRLGCVPAINLVSQRAKHERADLAAGAPLRPFGAARLEVVGIQEVWAGGQTYLSRGDDYQDNAWYDFSLQPRQQDLSDLTLDANLVLGVPQGRSLLEIANEEVNVRLWCCNGDRPSALGEGTPFVFQKGVPEWTAHCVIPPSKPMRPPMGQGPTWLLVDSLASVSEPLRDVDAVRNLLRAHDFWYWSEDRERRGASSARLASLVSFTITSAFRYVRAKDLASGQHVPPQAEVLCRGTIADLTLKAEERGNPYAAFLFACVMERIVAARAPVSSFTALVLRDTNNVFVEAKWPAVLGTRELL